MAFAEAFAQWQKRKAFCIYEYVGGAIEREMDRHLRIVKFGPKWRMEGGNLGGGRRKEKRRK